MQLDRRSFMAVLGVAGFSSVPGFAVGKEHVTQNTSALWVLDQHLPESSPWAAELERKGLRYLETSGDPGSVYNSLFSEDFQQHSTLIGLTTGMEIFALRELLSAYGYRLSFLEDVSRMSEAEASGSASGKSENFAEDPSRFESPVVWRLERSGTPFRRASSLAI